MFPTRPPSKPASQQLFCSDHDGAECRCYASGAPPAAQSLDELEFVRSACHAAQLGALDKLQRILASKPEAVSWDGGTGAGGGGRGEEGGACTSPACLAVPPPFDCL
jgi:hypothetical protein